MDYRPYRNHLLDRVDILLFFRRADLPPHAACSPFAMRHLQAYRWPGNVRELLAALESARIQSGGRRIETQHLPPDVRGNGSSENRPSERYRQNSATEDERSAITRALAETGGARSTAAARLGMSRTTLWRKMKLYGLEGADPVEGN